jgi:hypothetical protein
MLLLRANTVMKKCSGSGIDAEHRGRRSVKPMGMRSCSAITEPMDADDDGQADAVDPQDNAEVR